MARNAGLEIGNVSGMSYNPLTRIYALGDDTQVNYLMATRRAAL